MDLVIMHNYMSYEVKHDYFCCVSLLKGAAVAEPM